MMGETIIDKLVDLIEKQQDVLRLSHHTMKSMIPDIAREDLQEVYSKSLGHLDNIIHSLDEIVQPILDIVKGKPND